MIEIAVLAAAVIAALVAGFLVGRRRAARPEGEADWKVRLAARDRDLAEAVDRMIEAELALQHALTQQGAALDDEATARIQVLTEELAEAEDELTRLRALGVDKAPAAGSLARRLETLEAELATLESFRCPDPSAHRRRPVEVPAPPPAAVPVPGAAPPDDDLTLITGVGEGLAEIFRRLGYRTFDDVARMTDDDLEAIRELAGGVAGPASREAWVRSAQRLADDRTDAA